MHACINQKLTEPKIVNERISIEDEARYLKNDKVTGPYKERQELLPSTLVEERAMERIVAGDCFQPVSRNTFRKSPHR